MDIVKRYLILFILFFSICFSDNWWNENWKYRISLKIRNDKDIKLENIPIIIKGEILRKKTGLLKEKIATNSIRIIDSENKEVPVQVDEKDATGLYCEIGNGELDRDDEIIFQVSLKEKEEKSFYIYFTDKLGPFPEYQTDLKFKKVVYSDIANYNAEISNSIISIGVRGAGKEIGPDGKPYLGGLGKASITSFRINDKQIIYQGHSWGWYLGRTAVSDLPLPWDDPFLLIDGSVRKVVVCKALNVDKNFTSEFKPWVLSGKVKGDYYRYFILYSKIPYCEMIEIIKIESAEPNYRCLYQFSWCPTYPRDWENDKMYVPLAGKATIINFSDERNYNTKKPEEGWLAIANVKEKRGLALFFNKEIITDVNADFYGLGMDREKILSNEWSKRYFHTSVRVFYGYNDFNTQNIRENKFGFYGITEEKAEEIRGIYKAIWEGLVLNFGFPEQKENK